MSGFSKQGELQNAISVGDLETARALLEGGASPHSLAGPDDARLIHFAAQKGDVAALALLLEFDADINAQTGWGSTALFFAAASGHEEAVEFLLERGADADLKTVNGISPAITAGEHGHLNILKRLVAHKEAAGDLMHKEQGHIRQMAIINDRADVVEFCLDHWPVADINAQDRQGMALIHWAAHNGAANVVRMLIDRGAVDNCDCGDGRTMMDFAQNTPVEAVLNERASLRNSQRLAKVFKSLRSRGAGPRM